MLDRLTNEARRAIVNASDEARRLDHGYIGTEHLLLGLLRHGQGVAVSALQAVGVSLDGARERFESMVGRGESAPGGHLSFTPGVQQVLFQSLEESHRLGRDAIEPEHLLLALLHDDADPTRQLLALLGTDADSVRQQVVRRLASSEGSPS